MECKILHFHIFLFYRNGGYSPYFSFLLLGKVGMHFFERRSFIMFRSIFLRLLTNPSSSFSAHPSVSFTSCLRECRLKRIAILRHKSPIKLLEREIFHRFVHSVGEFNAQQLSSPLPTKRFLQLAE